MPAIQVVATAATTVVPTASPPPLTNIRNQTSAVQVVPTATTPPQANLANEAAVVLSPVTPAPDTLVHNGATDETAGDVALTTPDYVEPGDHELDFAPSVQS